MFGPNMQHAFWGYRHQTFHLFFTYSTDRANAACFVSKTRAGVPPEGLPQTKWGSLERETHPGDAPSTTSTPQ